MWTDTIVEEIRAIRQKHAQQYNYDLRAIFSALKADEQASGRQVVTLSPRRKRMEKRHLAEERQKL
ncbi:MAG: hypothetical protein RBT80_20445 [Candidatus Vecturithrix sp.]|jgi:hypothetical protein|nr:hypothetical protein [Candidatus Vecturithrix sp.]